MTDHEKYKWIKDNLYVPVVCDILDQLGYRHQAMHQRLRPRDETCCVFVGRARTFRWLETDYVVQDNPYGREIEAMDSLGENDVAVHSTDSGGTNAPWGELMSTAAMMRKGAVSVSGTARSATASASKKWDFPYFMRESVRWTVKDGGWWWIMMFRCAVVMFW